MQHTLISPVVFNGIGLHSGAVTRMLVRPAPVNSGISFIRTDVTDRDNLIKARYDNVIDTRLCTLIGNKEGVTVGTIEHLMAALAALHIDNAIIELDGPEVPIMDGSSILFFEEIKNAGITAQNAPRRAIKILKEVTVTDGDKTATIKPSIGSQFSVEIDFPHASIGRQAFDFDLLQDDFATDIASARTFGFIHEIKYLRTQGLALGASMDNAIALDNDGVANPEGLRFDDEFSRHKLLDAIGDLYLMGSVFLGQMISYKGGHDMNNRLARAVFADPSNYMLVDLFSTTHPVNLSPKTNQIPVYSAGLPVANIA